MPNPSEKHDAYIILNPHAAKGRAAQQEAQIRELFTQLDFPFEIVRTEAPLHASQLAADALLDGKKLIVAAGGDGTLNEIVDGLMSTAIAKELSFDQLPIIGILPVGRGNDFGYVAKVPRNLKQAVQLIVEQKWQRIDCGKLTGGLFPQGRFFINGVGLGFEPAVNFVASSFTKVSGMASYLLAFAKLMTKYPQPVRVELTNDTETISFDTQQISICNGRRMGSAFIMAPYAEINDGLLDICFANQPIKKNQILWYALKFFNGSQMKSSRFSMMRGKKVTVQSAGDLPIHTDGEEVCRACRHLEVEIFPSALKFVGKE